MREAPKGKIWKTNSNCEEILVDDPDYYNEGIKIKKRNKPTNITPKKKKRR